jgi:Na+/H+ antiporter NhaA
LTPTETTAGLVLSAAVVAALSRSNVAHGSYQALWSGTVAGPRGSRALVGNVADLVDNALMTVFFLAIGLEIGRERATGSLRSGHQAMLPVIAALGGMVGAAVVHLVVAGWIGAPVRWRHLVGAAIMCGSGFTVPLLFADAAFHTHPDLVHASQAALVATLVAVGLGGALLLATRRPRRSGDYPRSPSTPTAQGTPVPPRPQ